MGTNNVNDGHTNFNRDEAQFTTNFHTSKRSESQLSDFLRGVRRGNLGELSAWQLRRINELHSKVISEEEKMKRELASLQECLADQQFVVMATEFWRASTEASSDKNVRRVLGEQGMTFVDIIWRKQIS
ncbi:hypothetical protein Scep_011677 [Stephania cephalantha]|uniref:Uncharacterized protein n=1 Tax=Stephania cephalantha TaxID=152367 RepID=A0AAP0JDS3_9MAGN